MQRDLVAALVAQDMPRDAIAAVLGLETDKLEAAFARELEHGHAIVKAKITASLLSAVDGDSVAAARKLDEMLSSVDSKPAAPKLGKKEAARRGASEAVQNGGRFAPRPSPGGADGQRERDLLPLGTLSRNKLQ